MALCPIVLKEVSFTMWSSLLCKGTLMGGADNKGGELLKGQTVDCSLISPGKDNLNQYSHLYSAHTQQWP